MFKKTLLTLNLLACVLLANSQTFTRTVVSCGGGFCDNSDKNFSFTIGELSIKTIYLLDYTFTEGFQQGAIHQTISSPDGIYIGPNPVRKNLYIYFMLDSDNSFLAQVFNLNGKLVNTEIFDNVSKNSPKCIDFSNYLDGLYFVKIISATGKYMKTFKVEKM